MNEQARQDASELLLLEGSSIFLDALYALYRYQKTVTEIACDVLTRRLGELASVMGVERPVPDAAPYCQPAGVGSDWNGSWAWVAAQVWFPEPCKCSCYFGLLFNRDETEKAPTAHVTFMYGGSRAPVFKKLKLAFRDKGARVLYCNDESVRQCGFTRALQDPLSMEAEFEEMMDHVIGVWRGIGGWDKLFN